MVKFSKQFEGQLVPEWRAAFVDYWNLKKEVKKISLEEPTQTSLSSYLLKKLSCLNNNEEKVIKVHTKPVTLNNREEWYQTELHQQLADNESVREFFTCLDLQLNKVNQFYRAKEAEYVDRGDSLKKQLFILLDLREDNGESSQDSSISYSISSDIKELNHPKEEEVVKKGEKGMGKFLSDHIIGFHGRSLRIKIPLTNPSRTFSAISYLLWEDHDHLHSPPSGKVRIDKRKLHQAEKMIRGAFLELYKGLSYLKTYRYLNLLAFVKILKKFDKITDKEILPVYLKVVESSYFNTSEKVIKLADEVEELFIKHFAEDDKRKAMKYLKPHQREETHCATFFIGLFTGTFLALLAGYITIAHIAGMYRKQEDTLYMETVYPVLSIFSLFFLHLFLYGCNIFTWRKTRINYGFIFELKPTKKLDYGDIFLICALSMSIVVGILFVHLLLIEKGYSSIRVQAIPGLLLVGFLVLLLCPFNLFLKSSRCCFLRVLRNTAFSPLYKVIMLDFFMADQLCSQVPLLRNLEYVACYYITGSYKSQDYGYCMRKKNYRDLAYAVSFLPYYWRAMQCARRWFDEGDMSHLANLGKYVSAMVAAGVRVTYENDRSRGWLFLVVIMSSVSTVYQLYWDYVKDWGLLQTHSRNPLLRNELVLRGKMIYYFSMGLNLVLRLAWLQSVLHSNIRGVDCRVTGLVLAALEVVRRGQWNFYRLENEHLNNAGKFRAVKTVPLPFHEADGE